MDGYKQQLLATKVILKKITLAKTLTKYYVTKIQVERMDGFVLVRPPSLTDMVEGEKQIPQVTP